KEGDFVAPAHGLRLDHHRRRARRAHGRGVRPHPEALHPDPGGASDRRTARMALSDEIGLRLPELHRDRGRGARAAVRPPFPRERHEFKDKRVSGVGGGDSALEIALEIFAAAKKVILVHRRGEFRAMEKNVEAVLKSPIEVRFDAEVTSIEGDRHVERAVVYDNRTLKKQVFDVDAVIVNIGFQPKITPLPKWGIELEGERLIKVKADMSTSVRGIYACGDIVSYPGKDKRIVTGCGEAVTAIMSVYKY